MYVAIYVHIVYVRMYLGTDKLCGWKRYTYVEEATKVSKNSPYNSQPTFPMAELQNYIARTHNL